MIKFFVYMCSAYVLHALKFVGECVCVHVCRGQSQKIAGFFLYTSPAYGFEPGSHRKLLACPLGQDGLPATFLDPAFCDSPMLGLQA